MSPFPFDFVCVRIPEDASEPYEEVTLTAKRPGDLTEWVRPRFAGGALSHTEALAHQFGAAAVSDKMGALNAVSAKGSVEVMALVKPSSTTLPVPYSATFMYYDELGALKGRQANQRAGELAIRCGVNLQSGLPGDVYVGRFRTEPSPTRPLDFKASELDPTSPWQLQAPAENEEYAKALAVYTQAAEAKKVGAGDSLPSKAAGAGAQAAAAGGLAAVGEPIEVALRDGEVLELEPDASGALPAATLSLCAHLVAATGRGGASDCAGQVVLELGARCGAVGLTLASLGAQHVCMADVAADNLIVAARNADAQLSAVRRRAVSVAPLSWADGWQAASAQIQAREFDVIVASDVASEKGVPLALLALVLLRASPHARLLLAVEEREAAADKARRAELLQLLRQKCLVDEASLGTGEAGAGVDLWRCTLRPDLPPDNLRLAQEEEGRAVAAAEEEAAAAAEVEEEEAPPPLPSRRPATVACHTYHTLFVSPSTGALLSCGAHVDEEHEGGGVGLHLLGHDVMRGAAVTVPAPVVGLWGVRVREVAAGCEHSLLLTERGAVFAWGDGEHGKLGLASASLAAGGVVKAPVPVTALVTAKATQVRCGKQFSLVVTDAGEVHSFGANESGQLGRPTAVAWDAAPALVEGLEGARVCAVGGGATHALAVARDGALYSWGGGGAGCLGHGAAGDEAAQPRPKRVEALRGVRVREAAAGDEFSLAVDASGGLWSWGCADDGRLGHGDEEGRCVPARVATLAETPVRAACAGGDHSVVLTEAGEVFTCGNGEEGQLGHGDERASQLAPRRVAGLAGVVEVQAGFFYSAALTEERALYTWGHGEGGKLGHGDEAEQPAPVAVGALEGCLV